MKKEYSYETMPERDKRSTKFLLGSIAIGTVAVFAISEYVQAHPAPRIQFENEFTGKGDCLDGTPFDPDEGATLNVNKNRGGQDIISVLPRDANSYSPSVLFFTADDGHINFADKQTGTFLVDAGCIDIHSGS